MVNSSVLRSIVFFVLFAMATSAKAAPWNKTWFPDDPHAKVIGLTHIEALAFLQEDTPEVKLASAEVNNEAAQLTLQLYKAFANEYPVVMKNKPVPAVLVLDVKQWSPANVTTESGSFIIYPVNDWKTHSIETRRFVLAHEMVHFLFHDFTSSRLIWVKDKVGKIYDIHSDEARAWENIIYVTNALFYMTDRKLGIFASKELSFQLWKALTASDLECSAEVIQEHQKYSDLILSNLKFDSLNGRLNITEPERTYSRVNELQNQWRKCFDEILNIEGFREWNLEAFPAIQVLWMATLGNVPETFGGNPVDVALTMLNNLNSWEYGMRKSLGIESGPINFYTIEDQADDMTAVVLQNQNIPFNRRTLLDIERETSTPSDIQFCLTQLNSSRVISRSNIFYGFHRDSCARVQRLEHYSKNLKSYPGDKGFK